MTGTEPIGTRVRVARLWRVLLATAAVWAVCGTGASTGRPATREAEANLLQWNTNRNRVTADIGSASLYETLKRVSAATGWRVYLEPGTSRRVSAKFASVPPGEALRFLLGDLNYALVPETRDGFRLFVFRTSRQNATELVPAGPLEGGRPDARRIANELVVKLRPGAKIEEIAKRLGARVTGRIDELGAYRLEFDDEASAEAARKELQASSDVETVDNNFAIAQPPPVQQAPGAGLPSPLTLQLAPPPENGRVVIGLVDTSVQPLGGNLDQFLMDPITVAGAGALESNDPFHGTSMAETILRGLQDATQGKTSVQILPVDVYGAGGQTTTFTVSEGIIRAVNGGADIINLSLGSEGDDSVLRAVIEELRKKNIPVLAAAGNEPVTTPVYPAAYPGVNAVTALDQGQLAPYANRGDFVSLAAPGTTVIYYQGRPYQVVGTSPATATTSAHAAGYMERTGSTAAATIDYLRSRFGIAVGN